MERRIHCFKIWKYNIFYSTYWKRMRQEQFSAWIPCDIVLREVRRQGRSLFQSYLLWILLVSYIIPLCYVGDFPEGFWTFAMAWPITIYSPPQHSVQWSVRVCYFLYKSKKFGTSGFYLVTVYQLVSLSLAVVASNLILSLSFVETQKTVGISHRSPSFHQVYNMFKSWDP